MKLKKPRMATRIISIACATLILPMSFTSGISQTQSQPTSGTKPTIQVCQFSRASGAWQGSCGPLFGQNPTLTIAPAKAITTGVWRKGAKPTTVWAGNMNTRNPSAIEIEIYDGGSGVMRTDFRWLPVSGFVLAGETLQFQLDTVNQVPPNELDREIVRRSASLLSSESVWNRADTRVCAPTDTKWSIYCAMQHATIEVTGAFHHRRPALELVRQIVDKRTANKDYNHRLMDYNNDPSTRLEDVRTLFAEALARMGG